MSASPGNASATRWKNSSANSGTSCITARRSRDHARTPRSKLADGREDPRRDVPRLGRRCRPAGGRRAATKRHGARRRWLSASPAATSAMPPARRDDETLRLPPRIACFPDAALNRDLYLWLAALAAAACAGRRLAGRQPARHACACSHATRACEPLREARRSRDRAGASRRTSCRPTKPPQERAIRVAAARTRPHSATAARRSARRSRCRCGWYRSHRATNSARPPRRHHAGERCRPHPGRRRESAGAPSTSMPATARTASC